MDKDKMQWLFLTSLVLIISLLVHTIAFLANLGFILLLPLAANATIWLSKTKAPFFDSSQLPMGLTFINVLLLCISAYYLVVINLVLFNAGLPLLGSEFGINIIRTASILLTFSYPALTFACLYALAHKKHLLCMGCCLIMAMFGLWWAPRVVLNFPWIWNWLEWPLELVELFYYTLALAVPLTTILWALRDRKQKIASC